MRFRHGGNGFSVAAADISQYLDVLKVHHYSPTQHDILCLFCLETLFVVLYSSILRIARSTNSDVERLKSILFECHRPCKLVLVQRLRRRIYRVTEGR